MPTRVFLVLMLAFGGLAFCAPPAKAECRTEAGFTSCPKDEFAKLMEKLATARGEERICHVTLEDTQGKLEDTQAALDKLTTVVPPAQTSSRWSYALGAVGGALAASAPWLASNTSSRFTIVSTGLLTLAAGWLLTE